MSSLTLSTSSNEALALQAAVPRDAIKAQIAGDAIGAKIARNSSRFVAWMDSIPPERLEIELFGYSAHEITRLDYERRAGQALCRGRKYVPPPARGQAPKIEALVANSTPPAENCPAPASRAADAHQRFQAGEQSRDRGRPLRNQARWHGRRRHPARAKPPSRTRGSTISR